MAIDFLPLKDIMKAKGISWYQLAQEGIDSKTIDRLRHNRNITTKTIDWLCTIIDCGPEDIIRRIPEE